LIAGIQSPLVSVVVPAFNAELFLDRCLASIEGQTYGNWELILVNDGSTDETQMIAEAFMGRHPDQVRVISTRNQGLSCARNNGLAVAQGEYVAFLDSDDVWLPEKLESQVMLLMHSPGAQATSCSFARFDSNRPTRTAVYHFAWSRESVRQWLLLEGPGPALGSTLMVRRSVLPAIGLFDAALGSHAEDLDFACRMIAVGAVVDSPGVLAGIRVWNGQIHGDDRSMEASLRLLFQRHLGAEPEQAKRALANLEILLASRQLLRGQTRAGVQRITAALTMSIARVLVFPWQLARKRWHSRLREQGDAAGLSAIARG
jgi:glycosyltransferase involved in cell wall biosynthesis